MVPPKYTPDSLTTALQRGGVSDLRFACEVAERIVSAVIKHKDEENIGAGFPAFRARKGCIEEEVPEAGRLDFYPYIKSDIAAPPSGNSKIGRFNAPKSSVLYLATKREVALAEVRASYTDICTIGTFTTCRPLRLGTLLRIKKEPLRVLLEDDPSEDDLELWLLARTAEFVSRRVSDDERELHYRACNLIASAFQQNGFDGLAYRTSFWSPGWRDDQQTEDEDHIYSSNLVFFDPKDAKPVRSALYHINWKRPFSEVAGNAIWKAQPSTES
ncbi:RES domain-containing protein [Martelella mediterranea]|uniref:RES domain-containing protein n=2 Tax=Martelella mediterranea TaxID=293089 RepID=A0A4R3NJX7_9HYPH|nr:RES domain-containing protein [Martelella mediterranea]